MVLANLRPKQRSRQSMAAGGGSLQGQVEVWSVKAGQAQSNHRTGKWGSPSRFPRPSGEGTHYGRAGGFGQLAVTVDQGAGNGSDTWGQ